VKGRDAKNSALLLMLTQRWTVGSDCAQTFTAVMLICYSGPGRLGTACDQVQAAQNNLVAGRRRAVGQVRDDPRWVWAC